MHTDLVFDVGCGVLCTIEIGIWQRLKVVCMFVSPFVRRSWPEKLLIFHSSSHIIVLTFDMRKSITMRNIYKIGIQWKKYLDLKMQGMFKKIDFPIFFSIYGAIYVWHTSNKRLNIALSQTKRAVCLVKLLSVAFWKI